MPGKAKTGLHRVLGLRDLVLFNIVIVVGVRWLAAAAHTGPGSVTLWITAALLFFVPSTLVVAGLSRRYPEEGGLYVWTKQAFGPWHGFLCGVSYILSTLAYLPSLVLSGLAMGAAAFGFRQDKWYVVALAVGILWAVLAANLVGLEVGKWTSGFGGMATLGAGALIMAGGALAWFHGGPAAPLTGFLPRWDWDKLNFWSQIALAFTGLELGAVLAGEIRDPRRTIPRAAWISGLGISGIYVGGTLAVLCLLPAEQVNIMSGLIQAGDAAGARLGWAAFPAVTAFLILVGTAGGIGSWLNGTARLPFVIGIDEYLPPAFGRLHPRWGTPWVALVAEGLVCTVFLLAMTVGETLQTGYQLLVDLTTVTTLLPFLYIFAAGWKSEGNQGSGWIRLGAICGIGVTGLALALAFVPPEGARLQYEAKLLGGCAAVVGAARLNYKYALRRNITHDPTQRGRETIWPQNPV